MSLQKTALNWRGFPASFSAPSRNLCFSGKPDVSVSIQKKLLKDKSVDLVPRFSSFGSGRNARQKSRLSAPCQQLIERGLVEHVAKVVGGYVCVRHCSMGWKADLVDQPFGHALITQHLIGKSRQSWPKP